MTPVHGVDVRDCLYWAVGASSLAARCHVMGPSLSPSRLGDLTGHYGGPRGRPEPARRIPAAVPGALKPAECLACQSAGADFIKLFPAISSSPESLRQMLTARSITDWGMM